MALPPSFDDAAGTNRGKRGFLWSALRAALAVAIAFFISGIKLDFIESYFYDIRMRLRPAPVSTDAVRLVMLTPTSIERLRGTPDFTIHADLLARLESVRPRAIVYDFRLEEIPGTPADQLAFAQVADRLPQFNLLTDELEMKGEEGKLRRLPPFDHLRVVSGPKSSDSKNFAKDGVTRRFLIDYQGQRMIHIELAAKFNPAIEDLSRIRGLFDFLGTSQAYINFRPAGSVPATSFADILQGQADLEQFRDKIVIVGQDTQISERDYAQTPYSREAVAMTSAEVHANIVETLIRNDSPIRGPKWIDFLFIALICLVTVGVLFTAKPTRGLMVLGATLLTFLGLAGLLFWPGGVWISMAHPLLAFFLCSYFFIPYRLIVENRRSWEIFQKHRLLQQVEELKTNFISMMSHDLKTPIARIQGMTDVIEKDPAPLSSAQREALDTIRSSNDDLLKFINSILQYGRIEAQQVQLHRQSKDVNSLLSEVIKKHEFLAKLKRIQILAELEPLFPIPFDNDLIRQVLSNLVENAIKYSPEETKILVSSEERDGWVVVQVADQGPGIPADEVANIFMKFFRSKNAKSSPVKGSGLGLYLAKYFTELHGGRVSVESTYGQGCTFTVELPIDPGRNHAESAGG